MLISVAHNEPINDTITILGISVLAVLLVTDHPMFSVWE